MDCRADLACTLMQVLLADNIFITRIEWCKKKYAPYHEFLVVYVQERGNTDGQPPRESVIAIQRNLGNLERRKDESKDKDEISDGTEELIFENLDGSDMPPPADPLPRVATAAFGLSARTSSSFSKTGLSAADTLHFSTDGTATFVTRIQDCHIVCRTLHIVGEHISVPQLVLLASVAHNHWRTYRWYDYQCFWYAHVVYTTIQKMVPKANDRGESGWYQVMHDRSLDAGQFKLNDKAKPFYVKRGAASTGSIVQQKYLAAWREYEIEIAAVKAKKDEEHIAVSTG